jgi:tetratricopeptide (TPR) repeat protein
MPRVLQSRKNVSSAQGVAMIKRAALLVLAVTLGMLPAISSSAETRVGTVQSCAGTVTIDAFGKGAFIAAVKGDSLYASTVLKTGANGRASIALQEQTREIPPGATVKIADLLDTGKRKSSLGWFASVGRLINSLTKAAQRKEDDIVLGSRAADISQEQDDSAMSWEVEETDAEVLIPQARKDIDAGSYAAALVTLGKADPPTEPQTTWNLWFWKGVCYFQLEDYADAAASLSAANAVRGASLGTPDARALPLFQLGSSWFLLGKNDAAIPVLNAYLQQNANGPYAPYATLLLSKALAASGDAAKSRAIAIEGARKYSGSGLDADFAALGK